ncbi:MAG TPA: response regulator [Stellaceae bacterium]|jgi:DNA-binding response OmpR family regulator|nr:response regulator [Stellaceae bacterium]
MVSKPRILLVDDERAIRDLLANVLWDGGYAIDTAGTAAEAMDCLDRSAYSVVITDWRLPDGDGLLIADAAAQMGAETLLMSGYLFQMPGGRAEQHETLMKPVRPSELLAAVEDKIRENRVTGPR